MPIDNIYGTLSLLKLDSTQQYSDLSRIREEIDGAGSYTMFAPSNDAWKQLDAVCIKRDRFPFCSHFTPHHTTFDIIYLYLSVSCAVELL